VGLGMLRLTNFDDPRRRSWCAVVVLLAVSSLTVSVATRYTFSRGIADHTSTVLQKHSASERGRQRLLNNAATWMPPVVSATIVPFPSSSPRVAPSGPLVPSLHFEKNLYNRPPPFLNTPYV
jgi:hypothetical protein